MINPYIIPSFSGRLLLIIILFFSLTIQAQVGIGTTTPNASSALDIKSTTQGLLAPRMTTAQRTAITVSATTDGLLVYDTDLKSFYFYNATTWVKINSASNQRDNYKLVKSAADFPAPESGKITLLSNTYYEINGKIILTAPINLNDAFVSGFDANEDVLFRTTGPVFEGITGGTIRSVTISGGAGASAFNITGGTSLVIQNTIIANLSSVGTISNVGLYFGNIIQFVNNTKGITYSNISSLLLSNQGWFDTNSGTFETYIGAFGLIEKVNGLSNVLPGRTGMNTTGITSITSGAILSQVVFYGGGSYVNGSSPYTGYNFGKDWTVDCPGIPREGDAEATGYYYMVGNTTPTTMTASNLPVKIAGTTTATNLFRVTNPSNNRLDYKGIKSRNFEITGTGTVDNTSGNRTYTFYIYKNGVKQNAISAERKFANNDIGNFTLIGLVNLVKDDYIEVYAENRGNDNAILVTRLSLILK